MQRLPRVADGLVVEDVSGEILVYQPRLQRSIALAAVEARVLRLCQGRATRAEARAAVPERALDRALARLRREDLLAPERLPRRRPDLVMQELAGEVLLMDPRTGQAHRLNAPAARVLLRCDGRTRVVDAAPEESEAGEDAVWMALALLREKGLLEPAPGLATASTRRAFLARWGKAAALVPVIASVIIPTPAHAQSSQCIQANCGVELGPTTRLTQCVPCCAPPPCGCDGSNLCMTVYSSLPGGSCATDTVVGVICTLVNIGGAPQFQPDCGLARLSSAGGGYSCCLCAAPPP